MCEKCDCKSVVLYECVKCHKLSFSSKGGFKEELEIPKPIDKRVLVLCPQCLKKG